MVCVRLANLTYFEFRHGGIVFLLFDILYLNSFPPSIMQAGKDSIDSHEGVIAIIYSLQLIET